MIVRVTENTTRLGVRIKTWKHQSYVADWRHVVLVLLPGQLDCPTGPNGSPWILHGCWYGLPTEVDTANPPPPDFPAITVPASGTGDDCELVFMLPPRFREIPYGRYTGMVQYIPADPPDPCAEDEPKKKRPKRPKTWADSLPPQYISCDCLPKPPVCPVPKVIPACVLAVFDIDVGQRCDEHVVDYASVTYGRAWCEEDD